MYRNPLSTFSLRRALLGGVLGLAALGASLPAAAQAVYRYTGLPFTMFSCGPSSSGTGTANCSEPAPTNPYTSYAATDRVTGTLTLASPLPASMALTDVRGLAGFALELSDVRHTVTNLMQVGMAAEVATDAAGNISAWRVIVNTGGIDNGGILTQKSSFVSDMGTLRCCDPTVSGDFARNANLPGTWVADSAPPSPAAAIASLKTLLASPELALTTGQVNSLGDKLDKALASVQAGLVKQAVNQLNAFVSAVETARKTGKMSASAASTLTAAANAIIASLV